jgi:hypothetical protein
VYIFARHIPDSLFSFFLRDPVRYCSGKSIQSVLSIMASCPSVAGFLSKRRNIDGIRPFYGLSERMEVFNIGAMVFAATEN